MVTGTPTSTDMAELDRPTSPKEGEKVTLLWRHVKKLAKIVEAQQLEIAALKQLVGPRRGLINVVYTKCCLDDSTVCYLPVMSAGPAYRSKPETAVATTIKEADLPAGAYVLE